MTLEEVRTQLTQAAKDGTLMTAKHDPLNLSTTYPKYRSVLSTETAANLESFIVSTGGYTISEYENKSCSSSPIYLVIVPKADSTFSVPASGVAPSSPVASTALDRIVAVSGKKQGWHLFGEDSAVIQRKVSNGELVLKANL